MNEISPLMSMFPVYIGNQYKQLTLYIWNYIIFMLCKIL
jgi:hypothetical protein